MRNSVSFPEIPSPAIMSFEDAARHVLALAKEEKSLEAILYFQEWIFKRRREAAATCSWFSFTPVLKACMWLKKHSGALGQAVVYHTEAIPRDLRDVVLHGDLPQATTTKVPPRSAFHVTSVGGRTPYRLGCHDYYHTDKNERGELKIIGHSPFDYYGLAWYFEVTSDGYLVFRYEHDAWKEFLMRNPARVSKLAGQPVLLGAMPLKLDAVHTWEVCVASDSNGCEVPEAQSKIQLKAVMPEYLKDANHYFLGLEGEKRDRYSFLTDLESRTPQSRASAPSWTIKQASLGEGCERLAL